MNFLNTYKQTPLAPPFIRHLHLLDYFVKKKSIRRFLTVKDFERCKYKTINFILVKCFLNNNQYHKCYPRRKTTTPFYLFLRVQNNYFFKNSETVYILSYLSFSIQALREGVFCQLIWEYSSLHVDCAYWCTRKKLNASTN